MVIVVDSISFQLPITQLPICGQRPGAPLANSRPQRRLGPDERRLGPAPHHRRQPAAARGGPTRQPEPHAVRARPQRRPQLSHR